MFDDDSESGSDSFTSTSQDSSLPLPASRGVTIGPDPLVLSATSDPLSLVDSGGGGRKEGVGVLRPSDSSDEEDEESGGRVMGLALGGSGGSLLASKDHSQTDRLRQQCSQVCSSPYIYIFQ